MTHIPCRLHRGWRLAAVLLLAGPPGGWSASMPGDARRPWIRLDGGVVRVTGPNLELTIRAGAVTGIRNRRTGDEFAPPGAPWDGLKELFGAKPPAWPGPDSPCELTEAGAGEAELAYRNLAGGGSEDELRYRVLLMPDTGDIVLQAALRYPGPTNAPAPSIPLVNVRAEAVILGCGARYTQADPPVVNAAVRTANNLYAPPVAVLEGARSCVFLWSESFRGLNNVWLDHRAGRDHLSLTTAHDYLANEPTVVRSVAWRFSALPSWPDAARRYRLAFEKAFDARPLWNYPVAWVRGIHAVHTEAAGGTHGSPTPEQANAYYRDLAAVVDPAKLLLFYWNGNSIVLFGDHRHMTRLGWPKAPAVAAIRKHGFHWMGYHPYVLVMAPKGIPARFEEIARNNWGLPEGYAFTPDYGGPPDGFYDFVRPVAHGYYQRDQALEDMTGLWVLHPGSRRAREYLVRNFGNSCAFHAMDGAYMDILGVGGHTWECPEDRKVMDGLDGYGGEAAALRDLRAALPDLAVMSECQSEWTTAYTFFTWEGASHFQLPRRYASITTKVNHPLRTALWGSYTWTRELDLDPAESALVGGLPRLVLADDWSVARAKLFADEELFNDLPAQWDPAALAYYRGRNNRWFQFRNLPFGDGYVELAGGDKRPPDIRAGARYRPCLVRLKGQTACPLDGPARIQGWVGYRDGRPIGLDPGEGYPLLFEEPGPEGFFWVTALPAKASIREVHHAKGHSVVTLGAPTGPAPTGEVAIVLHRPCLRICTAGEDLAGPFQSNQVVRLTTAAPGGLALVWEEPKPVDGRFRSNLAADTGHTLSSGVPDYLGWCYNATVRMTTESVGGRAWPVISIGPGRYRGHAEAWVALRAGARPVLKFDRGYPPPADRNLPRPKPLLGSVRVNGQEVWQGALTVSNAWQSSEVDLSRFAGRTVLVTLCAERPRGEGGEVAPSETPALFGRVRVDGNPDSLDRPDGTALPRPGTVIFADTFQGPALDPGWQVALSPASGKDSRIAPEDGMLAFTGGHYKYAYVARPLTAAASNLVAQARLRVKPTGCDAAWNPGLGLYWEKGRYARLTGGNDALVIRGYGARTITLTDRRMRVGDDNSYDFWVRIVLTSERIAYCSSLDGRAWTVEADVPRPAEVAGAPTLLLLGRGMDGPGDGLRNDEKWDVGMWTNYVGDLVVGQDRL